MQVPSQGLYMVSRVWEVVGARSVVLNLRGVGAALLALCLASGTRAVALALSAPGLSVRGVIVGWRGSWREEYHVVLMS